MEDTKVFVMKGDENRSPKAGLKSGGSDLWSGAMHLLTPVLSESGRNILDGSGFAEECPQNGWIRFMHPLVEFFFHGI